MLEKFIMIAFTVVLIGCQLGAILYMLVRAYGKIDELITELIDTLNKCIPEWRKSDLEFQEKDKHIKEIDRKTREILNKK